MGKADKKFNPKTASEMELVNAVNSLEESAWRLNHDASHGRIEWDIGDELKTLSNFKDAAVEELKKRTGISEFPKLRDYIREKLKEQNDMWDARWKELSKEGAVFKYKDFKNNIFETVRAYLPPCGTGGPNSYILARMHGTSSYRMFDDRNVPEIIQCKEIQSKYNRCIDDIIRVNEYNDPNYQSNKGKKINGDTRKKWYDLIETGALFIYEPNNVVYKTVRHVNLPGHKQILGNELIIGVCQTHRSELCEFSPYHIPSIRFIPMGTRYEIHGEKVEFR